MSVDYAKEVDSILRDLGISETEFIAGTLSVSTPLTGEQIAKVAMSNDSQFRVATEAARDAFDSWRLLPAPRRGELVRLLGNELRAEKAALARLLSIEVGKIPSESLGEIQEMIDVCDFAVGLSRQLYGLAMPSERPQHRIVEQWHPIGPIAVISAFNFPAAVWSWNAAVALVTGNPVVWKPSEKAPLTALAVSAIAKRACEKFGQDAPHGLLGLLIGKADAGEFLANSGSYPVVSATGSTEMGRSVGRQVADRFGRAILELGGNNASIVTATADLELALRAVVFAAVGTTGQRCTTLRRLFVHSRIYDSFIDKLKTAFGSVTVGDPLQDGALIGPLIDQHAYHQAQDVLTQLGASDAIVHGGERVQVNSESSFYMRPAIVEMAEQSEQVLRETFAPILYVLRYDKIDEALALNNAAPQGLSSSIFSTDVREIETFLSACGSDCGIANVNMGTSGAEIGGAFGGEKQTGGGRECGSDAWKSYMRRQTNSINYGNELPLAQGVSFEL